MRWTATTWSIAKDVTNGLGELHSIAFAFDLYEAFELVAPSLSPEANVVTMHSGPFGN